jgi:hypothetical protein
MNTIRKASNLFFAIVILISCSDSKENKKTKEVNNKDIQWQMSKVQDEFGDVIEGKSTLSAEFKGTFSNSAVTNQNLTVSMQISDSTIYTTFYEYNKPPKAELPQSQYSFLKIKTDNGEIIEVRQFLYNNAMLDMDKELLLLLLKQKKPIKVIMDFSEINKYSRTKYNFEIDPNGLKEFFK